VCIQQEEHILLKAQLTKPASRWNEESVLGLLIRQ
jgi:hypothetical protein